MRGKFCDWGNEAGTRTIVDSLMFEAGLLRLAALRNPPPSLAQITKTQLARMSQSTKAPKLHGRAFYESIGCPKLILAPMVEQSEFVRLPCL